MRPPDPPEIPPPISVNAQESPEDIAGRFHSLILGLVNGIKDLDERVKTLEALADRREKGGGFQGT